VSADALPGTFCFFNRAAVAEHAIVVDNECVVLDIEAHRSRCRGIVGILDELMRQRAIASEVSELSSKISQVVDAAR